MVVYNFLFIGVSPRAKIQIRSYIHTLNKNQKSIFSPLGALFFIFITVFLNFIWFILIDDLPPPNSKNYIVTYFSSFAPAYLSLLFYFFKYSLILCITLLLFYILESQKLK